MDSFGIVILIEETQLKLSIYSTNNLSYMIFHNHIFIGKIFLDCAGKAWGTIVAKDLADDCAGLMLNKKLMGTIGEEISRNINHSTN